MSNPSAGNKDRGAPIKSTAIESESDEGAAARSGLAKVFWTGEDARMRAGWRILIAALVLFGVLIGTNQGISALGLSGPAGRIIGHLPFFLATAAMLYAASRLDQRQVGDYGFAMGGQWWGDFAGGIALGVLMHGGVAAAHFGLGWAQTAGTFEMGAFGGPFALAMGIVLLQFAGVALWEEALFRGVFILNTAEGLSGWDVSLRTRVFGAWLVPTVVFGGLHALSAGGEGVALSAVVGQAILAGAYFGLPYVLTGNLALPLGLHLATNFADTALFGGTAPRFENFPAVLRMSTDFPGGWETVGGLGMPAQVVTMGLVLLWIHWTRGSLEIAPRLRRAAGWP